MRIRYAMNKPALVVTAFAVIAAVNPPSSALAAGVCSSNSCTTGTTSITYDGVSDAFEVTASSNAISAVSGTLTGSVGFYGVYGETSHLGQYAVYGVDAGNSSNGGYGVYGNSSYGFGVYGETGSATGVLGIQLAGVTGVGSANYAIGVQGLANVDSYGTGVYGEGSAGYGVYGTDDTSGVGVLGHSSTGPGIVGASGTFTVPSAAYGVWGYSTSAAGVAGITTTGHDGVYGESQDTTTSYAGVLGKNTGGGLGVYGVSSTAGGYGVYGSGAAYGVYGTSGTTTTSAGAVTGSNSGGGNGVYGVSSSGLGVGVYGSGSGFGVEGVSSGINSSGIYGEITGSSCATGCNAIYGDDEATAGTHWAGYFHGNVYVTNNITCGGTCTSDVRLKQNVKPLVGALEQILRLKGVSFEWKNPAEHNDHTGTQTGVIAQDVKTIYPQWVHETPDTHVLTVDPDQRTVLALMVEGFRELKTENDALKAQNTAQDERIARLEKLAGLSQISWAERNQTLLLMGLGLVGGFAGYSRLVSRRKREDETRA